jgi:hypothetical protein
LGLPSRYFIDVEGADFSFFPAPTTLYEFPYMKRETSQRFASAQIRGVFIALEYYDYYYV